MEIPQINPPQAKERLDADDGTVYLDVRSEVEYESGHVPGALNIPLMHFDPATRRMNPNAEFLRVAIAVLDPASKFVVGCQAGGRSQKACDLLASAGFTSLANVHGGFGGARDPAGRVLEAGWSQLGYPVSTELADGLTYASLKSKADSSGA